MGELARCVTSLALCLASYCMPSTATEIYLVSDDTGLIRYSNRPSYTSVRLDLQAASQKQVQSNYLKTSRTFRRSNPELDSLIQLYASEYQVDINLIYAVIEVESRFQAQAISSKGAIGLMQLMPATAARYGVTERANPAENLKGGVRYLKDLLTLHEGNVALALAAYNAGEGTVAKFGKRIPPYPETMLYVATVLSRMSGPHSISSP